MEEGGGWTEGRTDGRKMEEDDGKGRKMKEERKVGRWEGR
jgi:hypothetical protein